MAKFYINQQDTTQNTQDVALTGVHAIIGKNVDNINVDSNNISGSILSNNSNQYIRNSNIITNKKVIATNNSFVYDQNPISTQISNNTFYNFKSQKYTQRITNLDNIKNYDCFGQLSLQMLNNIKVGPEDSLSSLSKFLWSKQLLNDGKKFFWTGNKLSDLEIAENIHSNNFYIDYNSNTQNYLNDFPKNLHGKSLIIRFNPGNSTSDNQLICSGFYNGTVKFCGNGNTTYGIDTCIKLKCLNLDALEITKLNFKNSSYITNGSLLYCENVENILIDDVRFYNSAGQTLQTQINNVFDDSSFNFQNYKNKLYDYYKNKKLAVHCQFINSTATIKNSLFDNCKIISIIASLNSKIISFNNLFKFQVPSSQGILKGIRRILFYGLANSFIVSSNCKAKIGSQVALNDEQMSSLQAQQNQIKSQLSDTPKYFHEVTRYTFLYGYCRPGSIFNHCHKDKILKKQKYNGLDYIGNYALPIGSIYSVQGKINPNILTNQEYQYDSDKFIGIHNLSSIPFIGNSYIDGYYKYIDNPKNSISGFFKVYNNFLKNIPVDGKWADNGIFPQITVEKRYKNQYVENMKYAYIFKWHFNLDTSPYFNDSILNTNTSLQSSTPSSVYNGFFSVSGKIQYSQFTFYNKTKYFFENTNFLDAIQIKKEL